MIDLLNYTKKVADRIKYYNAIVDFTDESHWFNPFFRQNDIVVIWTDEENSNKRLY